MAEYRIDIEKSAQNILDKIYERFGVSAERLVELAQADRDGRCVVLPAKMGDDVWLIVTKRPRVTMPEFSFVKHSRLTWNNYDGDCTGGKRRRGRRCH